MTHLFANKVKSNANKRGNDKRSKDKSGKSEKQGGKKRKEMKKVFETALLFHKFEYNCLSKQRISLFIN